MRPRGSNISCSITAVNGEHVLEGMTVDDREALAGFAPDDARRFARECEKARQQKR